MWALHKHNLCFLLPSSSLDFTFSSSAHALAHVLLSLSALSVSHRPTPNILDSYWTAVGPLPFGHLNCHFGLCAYTAVIWLQLRFCCVVGLDILEGGLREILDSPINSSLWALKTSKYTQSLACFRGPVQLWGPWILLNVYPMRHKTAFLGKYGGGKNGDNLWWKVHH